MAKPGEPKQSERGGVSDEVDASKGIFPAGAPHPSGAEPKMAGELGGGPYEESGRSSLEGAVEIERHQPAAPPVAARPDQREEEPPPEQREPRGSLPPHHESRPSASG